MRKTFSTNIVNTEGHLAVFYSSSKEMWQLLAEYFKVGFEQGELCLLVTHYPEQEVIANLAQAGLEDAGINVKKGSMRIFDMSSTYMPDGHFVSDFMTGNVLSFIDDAADQGYSGLRTAGEMAWLDEHPHFHDEAVSYEHGINSLTAYHPEFTGMCLYSTNEGQTPAMEMKSVLDTHPSYFYNGELLANPQFAS